MLFLNMLAYSIEEWQTVILQTPSLIKVLTSHLGPWKLTRDIWLIPLHDCALGPLCLCEPSTVDMVSVAVR